MNVRGEGVAGEGERVCVCVMVLFVIGQDKWIRSCTTGQTGRSHRSHRY